MIIRQMQKSFRFVIVLTIITGLIYPLFITLIGQIIFHKQANGSLIEYDGKIVGSKLIGQQFSQNKFFWGRPSATIPFAYNALQSKGSNLGPSNPQLLEQIQNRMNNLSKKNPNAQSSIPIDLVTTSASGLDPDITLAAALYQAPRVANARKIPLKTIEDMIINASKDYTLVIVGIKRVNVLQLNLALEQFNSQRKSQSE